MESNVSTFSLIASKTVVVINKVFLYTKVKGEYIHLSSITCMVLFLKIYMPYPFGVYSWV